MGKQLMSTGVSLRQLFIAVVTIGAVVIPAPAYAHELQSDGPVHVIMHIGPKDTPVANGQSQLTFYVFDDQGDFLGAHCDCTVTVTQDGTTVLSSPVEVKDNGVNHVGVVPVVFPDDGNYQIRFSGTPKAGYDFHAFHLSYVQNASQAKYVDPASAHDKPFFVGTAILGLAMVGFAFWVVREFKHE